MKTYQTAEVEGVLAGAPYFPMLLFPEATLPYERMPAAPQRLADILPLTQGVKLLKAASLNTPAGSALVPLAVMLVIAAVCTCPPLKFFRGGASKSHLPAAGARPGLRCFPSN
ncbi:MULTISPECIES: ABC transporter permease [Eubacteriales]|uniref:Uncharacterized protein n=1 Tax=Bittarella massiliensis (ex Durand et al. 2017) TaxID=1720313 RepID=A0ABW9WT46_9FIRM|nr:MULTISPECIES: ABC transporter permease [Eubacteriales]ERJ00017.1 hypothetical protein HMPREF0262_01315 [Clostridium sp. ATCC 29733]MZL68831.1 hypothetical protein [Bittarella massiliensis (ex Durand et al. 2017)]MZL80149.1 hypothetical protein [Bittarella massiliensis (ex Durand et al. 2017)]